MPADKHMVSAKRSGTEIERKRTEKNRLLHTAHRGGNGCKRKLGLLCLEFALTMYLRSGTTTSETSPCERGTGTWGGYTAFGLQAESAMLAKRSGRR